MVKVECEGCKAPYQVDEKRIPPTGLKMRCPKCGTSFMVAHDGAVTDASGNADLPASRTSSSTADTAPSAPRKATAAPRPGVPAPAAPPRQPPPAPAAPRARPPDFGDIDLPVATATPRGAPPAARVAPPARPAPPTQPLATLAFGELDLGGGPSLAPEAPASEPISAIPISSLPPSGGAGDLGTLDLPSLPARAPPPGVVDLPSIFAHGAPGGGVGLPLARPAPPGGRTHQGVGPVAPAFGEIDLPVRPAAPPRAAPPPPPRAPEPPRGAPASPDATSPGGFGEIDLPLVGPGHGARPATRAGPPVADLPSLTGVGLPMTAQSSVGLPARSTGSVGLPATVASGLPIAVHVGLPAAVSAGLPAPVNAGLPVVGGAGLPATATAVGMPAPAIAVGMPSPATAIGMPASAGATGMPSVAPQSDPISLAAMGLPMRGGNVVGAELYGSDPPLPPGSQPPMSDIPDMPIALESLPPGAGAYPATPPSPLPGGNGAFDSIDVDSSAARQLGANAGTLAGAPATAPGGMPAVKIAPPRSNKRRYLLLGVATLVIAGASLTLVEGWGPFGVHFITDKLGEGHFHDALDGLRGEAQRELDSDTATHAAVALQRAEARHDAAPRHQPTTGYWAYVTFVKGLRFGRSPGEESTARQETSKLAPGSTAVEVKLANAGSLAIEGNLAGARSALAGLDSDIDALVLAGEVELAAKAAPAAVTAWTTAVGKQRSARTLFGLARAQLAASDAAGVKKNAEEVLGLSPDHAGARILLAQVLWDERKEKEALALLKEVTEGVVKQASGVNELVEAFALLGRIHLSRSRMTLAQDAFEQARKLDPQSVQALLGSGELFYRSGRFTEAKSRFEAALSADADSVRAAVGRAKTELALGNMKEAKDQLAALRTKKPNEPLVALWLGRAEDTLGNKKAAETAYLDSIKVGGSQTDAIEAYVVLANLLASLGRNDDASARLAEASKKFPDSAALNRARGGVAMSAGRLEEAKQELEAALKTDDDLGARFELGQVLRRMRRFDEAGKAFDAVAAVDKDYPGLIVERGLIFEATGDSAKALAMYEEALKKAPDDADLKLRIGSTMVLAGQVTKKAIDILREVHKKRPTAEASHFLGRALLLEGSNLAEAQRHLEAAVNIDPNRAEYQLYAGWVANETGNPGRAEDTLKKALELDKDNGDAYWQRAVLHQKRGQCFDALEDVKLALEKKPSRFEAYATRAVCLSEQSRWPETIEAWNKAIAGNDSVAEWHYQLGRVLDTTGSAAGSAAEFEKALTLLGADAEKQTAWASQAHRLVGESLQASDPAKTETHFRRYLELAPVSDTYRKEVERWLEQHRKR